MAGARLPECKLHGVDDVDGQAVVGRLLGVLRHNRCGRLLVQHSGKRHDIAGIWAAFFQECQQYVCCWQEDPTEHVDLAKTMPAKLEELRARIKVLRQSLFNPDRCLPCELWLRFWI